MLVSFLPLCVLYTSPHTLKNFGQSNFKCWPVFQILRHHSLDINRPGFFFASYSSLSHFSFDIFVWFKMSLFLCFLLFLVSSATACDRCVHQTRAAYFSRASALNCKSLLFFFVCCFDWSICLIVWLKTWNLNIPRW